MDVLDHGGLKLPLKLLWQESSSVCFSRTNSQGIFHGIGRGFLSLSLLFFLSLSKKFGEKVRKLFAEFPARTRKLENLAIERSYGPRVVEICVVARKTILYIITRLEVFEFLLIGG